MMTVRPGTSEDFDVIIALMDEAVAWLAGQGRTGQWGSEPFSTLTRSVEYMRQEVEANDLWIAEIDGQPVGAMLLGEAPTRYVEPVEERELFLHLLVTSRRVIGQGVGRALVERAIAGGAGAGDRPDQGRLLRRGRPQAGPGLRAARIHPDARRDGQRVAGTGAGDAGIGEYVQNGHRVIDWARRYAMNIYLGKHFEEFIRKQVESGRYANASEVVREALRFHEINEIKRERLRAKWPKRTPTSSTVTSSR